jgi:biopolymer transport protein ExbB
VFADAIDILVRGGPVMAPILAVSVAAWIMIFMRLFAIRRESRELGEFLWRLESRLASGGRQSALSLCWESNVPVASLLSPLFAGPNLKKKDRRYLVQRAIEAERNRIGRHLPLLAVLASAATLLGLLGTVAGMIASFSVVTAHGTGQPTLLAEGVSEALITTETGLVVALPLLLMYSYLSSRADDISIEAHRKLLDVSSELAAAGVSRADEPVPGGRL